MSEPQVTSLDDWGKELGAIGKQLQTYARAAQKQLPDPFARRNVLDRTNEALAKAGLEKLTVPKALRDSLNNDCIKQTAEFWQTFATAAQSQGWPIVGTTNRRLVARGVFVELKGDSVSVEGLPGRTTPYVPGLVDKMKPLIAQLQPDKKGLPDFMDLLARAYDDLDGAGKELSVVRVFRNAAILMQTASFWSTMDPKTFHPLSRPMFRARMANILEEGTRTKDGRGLRLGTTVNPKEAWEVFSPTEGHVIQIGRLALTKLGDEP